MNPGGRPSSTPRPRRRDTYGPVLTTFDSLRDNTTGRLDVRVIEVGRSRRLDIRQFVSAVSAGSFSGYTRKGICLSAEEFNKLLEQAETIKAVLEDGART